MPKSRFKQVVQTAVAAFLLAVSTPSSSDNHAVDTQVREAVRLFSEQNYVPLEPLVEQLRDEADPHLEILFLSGMLHVRAGRYALAAEEFRVMLARDPTLIRPRLELARALQLAGDRQGAKYHYEQVLAAPLPDGVVRNIYGQLREIREREPSIRVTLDLSSDSNPRRSTHNRVVYIGGLPYRLNDDSRAESVWGLVATADVHVPLPSDPSWFAHAFGEIHEYPARSLDNQYLQASVGKRAGWGRNRLSLEVGRHINVRGGTLQYDGALVRAVAHVHPRQRLMFTSELAARTLNYRNLPYLTGKTYQAGMTSIFAQRPEQRWELSFGLTRYSARESAYSYLQPNATLRFAREWRGGWITGLRGQMLQTTFDADDPFFRQKRRDRERRIELDLVNRKVQWRSFSPRLLVGYARRDSNTTLYEFRRTYARIGVTRDF